MTPLLLTMFASLPPVVLPSGGPHAASVRAELCARLTCVDAAAAPPERAVLSLRAERVLHLELTSAEGLLITDTYPLRPDGTVSAWVARDARDRVITALETLARLRAARPRRAAVTSPGTAARG